MNKTRISNDPAILSVTTSAGHVLYHTRKGLVGYELREHATRFKTLTRAIQVARKKYSRMLGGYLTSWEASTQIPETPNRIENSDNILKGE